MTASVPRPDLDAALRRGRTRRHIAIVAGSGWGKTTLASAWAEMLGASWHALDHRHGDPGYLAGALLLDGGTAGTTGADHLDTDSLDRASIPDLAERVVEGWRRRDVNWLALDDVHALTGSPGMELLREVLGRSGPDLRVLSTARGDVGLIDDRQRAGGRVLELDARSLAMGTDLVAALVEQQLTPDRALAARIIDATGGWPAAVHLLLDALHDIEVDGRSAALHSLCAPSGPVGTYLRTIVLADEDPATVATLLRLGLLGASGSERFATITGDGTPRAPRIVDHLVQQGLARTDVRDVARVELAPLIRRFLLEGVLVERPDRDQLIDQVVDELVAAGSIARALDVTTRTERYADVAELLRLHGDRLVQAGELHGIVTAAEALPVAYRDETIDALQARTLAFRGDWAAALRWLEPLTGTGTGPLSTNLAVRLGFVHHVRGDLGAAIETYRRSDGSPDHREHIELLSWQATAHWLRGELDEARDCAAAAMTGARSRQVDRDLALAHTVQALIAASDGDRRANESHYLQALAAAERAGDALQQARILTNLASHHLEEGAYAESLHHVDRAIDLAQAQGFAPILGVARCNRAEILLRTGGLDEAIADAESARDIFARIGSRAESYAHHLMAGALSERGDLALARRAYARALRLGEPSGDRQALVPAHIGIARVMAGSDPDAAAASADRALQLDDGMERSKALLAAAWAALAGGHPDSARAHADAAASEAELRENHAAAAEAATCQALLSHDPVPGLHEALALWLQVDAPLWATRVELGIARRSPDPADRARAPELVQRLAGWGCTPERGLFAHRVTSGMDAHPRTIIRALGSFAVERSGRPVPGSEWGSKKARELCKILVTRTARGIQREELAHLLWPDQPYDDVSNRLSVALSVTRGVLSPGGGPSGISPILSHGPTVRLESAAVEVDVDAFRRLADDGLRAARRDEAREAVPLLSGAEELYGGDLFEDDPDLVGVDHQRTELRTLYLSVVRTLAKLISEEDPELTIRLLLRLLERDAHDEPAHLNLCLALLRVGRHGEARRRHRLYAERMAELDLPAVPFHELRIEITPGRDHRASA